jgi:uncharacterized RDD family membrane protein YckC
LAAIFDLVVIPILLGVVAGLAFIAAPVVVRNIALVLINVAWMIGRDLMFEGAGPGKKMAGIKVIDVASGQKMTIAQAAIRNILLIIPFVLVIGYLVEIAFLLFKGERICDKWAKTAVVMA